MEGLGDGVWRRIVRLKMLEGHGNGTYGAQQRDGKLLQRFQGVRCGGLLDELRFRMRSGNGGNVKGREAGFGTSARWRG
jgi:hypothetical protein